MMKLFAVPALMLVFASLVPGAAQADAKADATFVAERFLTKNSIDALFANLSPLIRQALANSFSQGPAKELSQTSREIVIEEFLAGFKAKFSLGIKSHYTDIYQGTLTQNELSALREFLETPEGAAFASKQHVLMTRGGAIGEKMGQKIGLEINREIGLRLSKDGEAFVPNKADREILLRMFPSR